MEKAEDNVNKQQTGAQAGSQEKKAAPRKSSGSPGSKTTTSRTTAAAKPSTKRGTGRVAKIGEAARELGAEAQKRAQKRVEKDIAPIARQAKKGLSETTKKVKEEIGPAAEKAGKGISAVFKATARATRKSARILGIKAKISAEMRKRQNLFARLGEAYFGTRKKKTPSNSDKEALSSLVAEIEQLNDEIRALELKEKTTRASS